MASVSFKQASAAPIVPPGSHNVKLFGAEGDGVVDDTTAIEVALAKVQEEGGILYFPPGVYNVTRTIRISVDGVKVSGASKRSTRIQFTPSILYPKLFLLESEDGSPLQHVIIEDLEIRAASDTTITKIAIDMHGTRHCTVRNVAVQGWADDDRESIALRIRGWDNLLFMGLSLNANYPVVIAKNDDGAGGYLDDTKDLDHTNFLRCNLVADNADKIAILVEDAVVYRNVTFDGIALVHGGFYNVDTTAPRRRSTNLAFYNIRCEGFAETVGSVVGVYAIDIRRHGAGKLRNVLVQNMLLAEGRDDAYGTTAANWNGGRFEGVWHKDLVGVTYSGQATPLTYTGATPVITGGQWTEGDNGKFKPAIEAQWDQIGVARPREWWTFANSSGSIGGQQDDDLSGLPNRNLAVSGSPLYQQFVEGWSSYHVKYNELTNERFGLNSGLTDFNPNDRSAAWMGWFKFPSAWVPGGDRVLINLGSCAQVDEHSCPGRRSRAQRVHHTGRYDRHLCGQHRRIRYSQLPRQAHRRPGCLQPDRYHLGRLCRNGRFRRDRDHHGHVCSRSGFGQRQGLRSRERLVHELRRLPRLRCHVVQRRRRVP